MAIKQWIRTAISGLLADTFNSLASGWIDLLGCVGDLKSYIQISLKELVLIKRIDADVIRAARTERIIDTPCVVIGEIERHCVAQGKAGPHNHTLHVQTSVEDIIVDQIWIE